jgi:nucleotide-binding universal stress UspA family protein
MFQSLLVPLDGSSLSEWSLPLATRVAKASGARLHLAHVHIPYEPDQLLSNTSFQWEGVDLHEYDVRHLQEEKEYLAGLEQRLGVDGTPVDSRVLDGPTVAEPLARYAAETHADLIFITSHGRSGVKRAWLGSVADQMIRSTALPMLIIHPRAGETVPEEVLTIRHILIPLDGSPRSESIIAPATELASATGARLSLVRVVSAPNSIGRRMMSPRPLDLEPEVEEARVYLEGVAGRLRTMGLDVSVYTAHDASPAVAIERLAERHGADLVALATHGYGGVKRTVLGSVADKLVTSSRRPLLVIRPSLEA